MRKIEVNKIKPIGLINTEGHHFVVFLMKIIIKNYKQNNVEDKEKYVLSHFLWTKEYGIHINSFDVITPNYMKNSLVSVSSDHAKIAARITLSEEKVRKADEFFMFDDNYLKWNAIYRSLHNLDEAKKKENDEYYQEKEYKDMDYDVFLKNHLSQSETQLLRESLAGKPGESITLKDIHNKILTIQKEGHLNEFFISF